MGVGNYVCELCKAPSYLPRCYQCFIDNGESFTKHDNGKPRLDLIPGEVLWQLGQVLEHGARKYEDNNWMRGAEYGRYYGAAMRHLAAWSGGQDTDPDSGLPHLAHALCSISFLITYQARGLGTDNRSKNESFWESPE